MASFLFFFLSRSHFLFFFSFANRFHGHLVWLCTLSYARKHKINYKLISVWIQVKNRFFFFLVQPRFDSVENLPRRFLWNMLKTAYMLTRHFAFIFIYTQISLESCENFKFAKQHMNWRKLLSHKIIESKLFIGKTRYRDTVCWETTSYEILR